VPLCSEDRFENLWKSSPRVFVTRNRFISASSKRATYPDAEQPNIAVATSFFFLKVIRILTTRVCATSSAIPGLLPATGNPHSRLSLLKTTSAFELLDLCSGVSAAVLRVVSDSFYRKLPDFNRALKNDGSLDGWKALRVALGSPLRTCRLLAANNRAVQDLARALDLVLNTSCFA
jgi:hypothetical protein